MTNRRDPTTPWATAAVAVSPSPNQNATQDTKIVTLNCVASADAFAMLLTLYRSWGSSTKATPSGLTMESPGRYERTETWWHT